MLMFLRACIYGIFVLPGSMPEYSERKRIMLDHLGEKDYVWKPTYKLEKPEHPNGLSYYDSYIYLDITINVIKKERND